MPFPYRLAGYAVAAATTAYLLLFRRRRVTMPDCSTEFTAHLHGGQRSMARVNLIVLHDTEGDTARGSAAWFANPASAGSTQVVVDDAMCFRTLPDNVVPAGSGGGGPGNNTNVRGLHIEFAGHYNWPREKWLAHDAMLARGGAVVGAWAAQYGIPLVMLGPAAVRNGLAGGVTTHKTISDAFSIPGGHQDPGPGFPLDVVLRYARGG